MSIVAFLLEKRTPLELAKELAASAKENALLRNQVSALETEVFWMKVADREADREARRERWREIED